MNDPGLGWRLKLAAMLAGGGLLVEAATLYTPHPAAFVAFIFLGGGLVAAGVLVYLYSLLSA